jgi:protein transport protein SEC13
LGTGRRRGDDGKWADERSLSAGEAALGDWVRDVAWAPAVGVPNGMIASCSEDKKVKIWTEDAKTGWKLSYELTFDCKVWRVSWSVMGNILAVSQVVASCFFLL